MKFTDTHTHLYHKEFDADRNAMLQRAADAGVHKMYLPNIDRHSVEGMHRMCDEYPGICFPMMGLHPCDVQPGWEAEKQWIEDWLGKRKYAAIGEIGIDLYWDKTTYDIQKDAFIYQTELALAHQLPIVIHSRNSFDEIVRILKEMGIKGQLKGVFHCFTGSYEQARMALDLGFYLGIGGVLTFKNSGIQEVVKQVPLESLVLETDSPYLAPVPYRGKRNESSYVPIVANYLAELRGQNTEEIAAATTLNAEILFAM